MNNDTHTHSNFLASIEKRIMRIQLCINCGIGKKMDIPNLVNSELEMDFECCLAFICHLVVWIWIFDSLNMFN